MKITTALVRENGAARHAAMRIRGSLSLVTSVAVLLTLGSLEVRAAAVSQNIGTLTRMWVYSTFGGGDIYFVGTSGAGTCQAFWLRATDAGAKNMYAVLLAARAANRSVRVYAYDNELWTGSATVTCRVDAIDTED